MIFMIFFFFFFVTDTWKDLHPLSSTPEPLPSPLDLNSEAFFFFFLQHGQITSITVQ